MRKNAFGFLCFGIVIGSVLGSVVFRFSEGVFSSSLSSKKVYSQHLSENLKSSSTRSKIDSSIKGINFSVSKKINYSKAIESFENLALVSPELANELNLNLVNIELKPISSSWEALGFTEDAAESFSRDLKEIITQLNKAEVVGMKVVNESDTELKVSLPPLDPSISSQLRGKVEQTFVDYFPEKTAEIFSNQFFRRRSRIISGIDNRPKLITFAKADQKRIDRGTKYRIITQIGLPGISAEQFSADPNTYRVITHREWAREIPPQYIHLFDEP